MASSIWSPIRSMVLYGPVFRREVRVPWLPLFGPLLGPWSDHPKGLALRRTFVIDRCTSVRLSLHIGVYFTYRGGL